MHKGLGSLQWCVLIALCMSYGNKETAVAAARDNDVELHCIESRHLRPFHNMRAVCAGKRHRAQASEQKPTLCARHATQNQSTGILGRSMGMSARTGAPRNADYRRPTFQRCVISIATQTYGKSQKRGVRNTPKR